MTSVAENSLKQLEIARNEQNLISNSFRSTIIELKQSGKFCIEGRRPPWKTISMADDLHGRQLSLEMTSIPRNQQSIMKNMYSLVKPKFGIQL
jgi:hypothetical protein